MTQSIKRNAALLCLSLLAIGFTDRTVYAQTTSDVENNPSIIALQESDPKTPEQLLFAVQITLGFDRMDELQRYAEQLLALSPNANTQLELHRRFGSPIFLELSDADRFGDELSDFAKQVLKTVADEARREDKIRELAAQAQADEETVRRGAIQQLQKAGEAAPPVLLNVLASATTDTQRDRLRVALMALGKDSEEPLIAALQSDNAAIVETASKALGRMKVLRATPHLAAIAVGDHPAANAAAEAIQRMVGAKPTKGEAILYLRKKIAGYRGGNLPSRPDLDGAVVLHEWDNEANISVEKRYPVEQARYREAARLSSYLTALSDEPEDKLNALVVQLHDMQLRSGPDQPIDTASDDWKLASSFTPDTLESALVEAVRRDWTPAATASLQALGASGEVTLVESKDGLPRPITKSLTHPDRRIRYAAARAIMQLNPERPYPGSSDLVDTLEYLVRSSGASRVLVGAPSRGVAQSVVGLVGAQGFLGVSTTRGREVIAEAQRRPDLEYILLSVRLSEPSAAETMHLLRQDPRSANLPIAIFAPENKLDLAERIAREDPLTIATPRLHSAAGAAIYLAKMERLRHGPTPQASRVIQAGAALRLLAQMVEDRERYGFYEVFRTEDAVIEALRLPALNPAAAKILGVLGTPLAQQTLVEMTLDRSVSKAERDTAFQALTAAVDSRGLMLTNAEVNRLYRELNKVAFQDETSKRLKKAVLDLFLGKKDATETPAEGKEDADAQ